MTSCARTFKYPNFTNTTVYLIQTRAQSRIPISNKPYQSSPQQPAKYFSKMSWMDSWSRPSKHAVTPPPLYLTVGDTVRHLNPNPGRIHPSADPAGPLTSAGPHSSAHPRKDSPS